MRATIWIFIFIASSRSLTGQEVIDLEGKAVLHYDGKSEAELTVNTDLIDGFVYRIPAELSVANDLKFMDLKGRTICQCASLQFDKNIVDSSSAVAGQILLRPKHSDLTQILEAFGTRPGELDPVVIARLKIQSKVYSPLRVVPSVVEVKDNRFPVSFIELQVSKGIKILEARMIDSNSVMKPVFEGDKNRFRIDSWDSRLPDPQGELVAEFSLKHKEKTINYVARIPYAPKPATRVIPAVVTLRISDDRYLARMVVTGFGPSETATPMLSLEKQDNEGVWRETNVSFQIDHFEFGKAIGHFDLPVDQTLIVSGSKSKFRLSDTVTHATMGEFDCVLVK